MSDLAKQFQADLDAGYGQMEPQHNESRMRPRKSSLIGSGITEAATSDPERQEQRSSVKVSVNAKGDRQWEVKSYDDDLERAFARAVEIDRREGVSAQQRAAALAGANRVRIARARLRRDLKTGEVTVTQARHLILDHPDYLETIRVAALVAWLPQVGPARARRILRRAGVPLDAKLGGLTERQKMALAQHVEERDAKTGGVGVRTLTRKDDPSGERRPTPPSNPKALA